MRTLLLSVLAVLSMVVAATGAAASPTVGEGAPGDAPETPGAAARQVDAVRYTYRIERRGDVEASFGEFAANVSGTLNDPRGWLRSNVTFRRTSLRPDLRIILASPSVVANAAPVCSAQYSCRVGDQVLINDARWRTDTAAWQESLQAYRDYLVNHEVGHWLDLGHRSCPGAGEPAYVMQQQSITLGGCDEHSWPRYAEVVQAASLNGVDPEFPGRDRTGVVGDPLWYTRPTIAAGPSSHRFEYGVNRDQPLMGDWDGDGVDTPALYYGGTWTLNDGFDGSGNVRFDYGTFGDIPVVGDWDGDGDDEVGVVRDGVWHLRNGTGGSGSTRYRTGYGYATDRPVVGDWNGDGVDGIGVYRGGVWHLRDDPAPGGRTNALPVYGWHGDVPVTGDWEGDGRDGIGVYRDGVWHLRSSLARTGPTVARTSYGFSDDTALTGDWDGDGDDEISVVRGRL